MCPPTYFRVTYSINPWMDPAKPVDPALALFQWEDLRDRYRSLGHAVDILQPLPGLPDMVFAANGATVVDGRVFGARFANIERRAEAPAHRDWFLGRGYTHVHDPQHINEGEGDFTVTESWLLAYKGFRSSPLSHSELQEYFGRPVIGLELTDPHFYHLDTALCVLSGNEVMYYPDAFSPGSRSVLQQALPRRADRHPRRRARLWPELRQRRPERPGPGRGQGTAQAAAGARFRTAHGRHVRAAQGGRQREVLHHGAARLTVIRRGPCLSSRTPTGPFGPPTTP